MQGVLTLSQMRLAARQEADMEQSKFVSDDELNFYINQGAYEMWDILTRKYGDDYLLAPSTYDFQAVAGTERYDLPADFYKLAGVDLTIASGMPGQRITLYPFNMAERNNFVVPNLPIAPMMSYGAGVRYKLAGNQIWLLPLVQSGMTIRLHYYQRMQEMADWGTIKLSGVVDGDTLTINGTTWTAGVDFVVGSDDLFTAQNLASLLSANALSLGIVDVQTNQDIVGFAGTIVQFQIFNSRITWSQTGNHLQLGILQTIAPNGQQKVLQAVASFADTFDGISGWLEAVILDAAIKMLDKENTDSTPLRARKLERLKHIETMATNRDAGMPKKVVRSRTGGWGNNAPPGFFPWSY